MSQRAIAYPVLWRIVAAVMTVVSRTAPLVLLALLWFSSEPPDNPLRLMRLFTALCLAPALVGWILQRAFAAKVLVEEGIVAVVQSGTRSDIPIGAITALEPWAVPLPGSGLWLRLRSGRRFNRGLQIDRPLAFLDAVAREGGANQVADAPRKPLVLYADARLAEGRLRWYHWLLRFPVFALVPTLPLYRLHQYIAYGGTFGEYYTYGLRAYLLGFAVYWGTFTVYVVMWAALWRAVVETIALTAAYAAPSRAARVRRAVEIAHRALYYGGVPVLLMLRFRA